MGKTLKTLKQIYEYTFKKSRGEKVSKLNEIIIETDEKSDFELIQNIIQSLYEIEHNAQADLLTKMDCYLDQLDIIADLMVPSHLEFAREK